MEAGGVEIGRFLRLETLALNRTTDAETDRVVVAMKNSLSKLKTAKRFATHFSISLHFTSAGITVLGIDLQVTWTRAKTSRLFFLLQTFLFSLSLIFSLRISLFIFHHLHAEEISTASRPCGTFSPLPAKALQLRRQLSSKTAPSRGEI